MQANTSSFIFNDLDRSWLNQQYLPLILKSPHGSRSQKSWVVWLWLLLECLWKSKPCQSEYSMKFTVPRTKSKTLYTNTCSHANVTQCFVGCSHLRMEMKTKWTNLKLITCIPSWHTQNPWCSLRLWFLLLPKVAEWLCQTWHSKKYKFGLKNFLV